MKNYFKFFYLFLILISFPFLSVFAQQIKTPEWVFDKTIYEVNIRQFTEEGTFKAFENHLPRLKELGAEILWLMPIHPIGKLNRKGTLGSYYSVQDYLEINPEFGSKSDFKNLVDKIHSLGMFVIIDWVANHTAWDHPWTKSNPEFYNKDEKGNFVLPVDDWTDVIDLNYDNKNLWQEMINALKYWVQEFNIDGYRCDVAGMIPIEFWIEARKQMDEIKPVFLLAEWDTPEMHKAFDMTYDWELHKIMNRIAKKENNVLDLIKHIKADNEKYPASAIRMQFTDNHDENSWNGTVFERLGEAAECFAVLTFIIPDMPLIYSGQEAGLDKRLSFFEKDNIEWKQHKYFDLYKSLTELKRSNEVLHCGIKGGELRIITNNNQLNILSLIRVKDNKKVLALFNLSNAPSKVLLKDNQISGSYTDFTTKEELKITESFETELDAWSWKIFLTK